jgi:hypothetical protein
MLSVRIVLSGWRDVGGIKNKVITYVVRVVKHVWVFEILQLFAGKDFKSR